MTPIHARNNLHDALHNNRDPVNNNYPNAIDNEISNTSLNKKSITNNNSHSKRNQLYSVDDPALIAPNKTSQNTHHNIPDMGSNVRQYVYKVDQFKNIHQTNNMNNQNNFNFNNISHQQFYTNQNKPQNQLSNPHPA